MQAQVLDNSMFDDGGIECRNFQVATQDDAYTCEYEWIQNNFSRNLVSIQIAVEEHKDYINVMGDDGIVYEVSWD